MNSISYQARVSLCGSYTASRGRMVANSIVPLESDIIAQSELDKMNNSMLVHTVDCSFQPFICLMATPAGENV